MCDHCSNQGIENAAGIADTAAAPDEMPKTYDPSSVEERLYKKWEERGYFHSEPNPDKPPYTIVIPPPNITGQLHMGHALDETMQDILIRYKRMSGFETLWLPGTDHASIATEVKVVNKLAAEGISKTDIGREGFLEHAWAWKKEYGGRIVTQLRKLGSSCDWERERFTMDDGCSHITGGGFYENVPRMLPDGVKAVIKKDSYEVPPIFKMLAEDGNIEEHMMYNTFNMGIGLVLAVDPADVDTVMAAVKAAGETPYVIGSIEAGEKGVTLC